MMSNLVKVSVPLKQSDARMTFSGAAQSGMGVFYQAIPDVGADGKNVMKLIPVQRVNGQFVRTHISSNVPNTCKNPDSETQRVFAQPIHFTPASRSSFPVTRYVLQSPSDVNFTVNPVNGTGNLQERVTVTRNTPIQVHVPIVTAKVTPTVVPAAPPVLNCGKTIALVNKKQLQVAVKSPALPSGHYLQIPPNAEVKSIPASALPHAIKKHILTPPENSSLDVSAATKSLPTVVYVSPVNALKLNSQAQTDSTRPAALSVKPSPKTFPQPLSVPAASFSQPAKSISKTNQAPGTPFKWVVQERSDMNAPFLVPQDSSMTLDILRTLAQMEKAQQSVSSNSSPSDNKSPVIPGMDNALVMCKGKMFFVAKKMSEFDHPSSLQKTSRNAGSPSKRVMTETKIQPSPNQSSSTSHELPKCKVPRLDTRSITSSNKVDEVIDLCDDDPQEQYVSLKVKGGDSLQSTSSKVVDVEEVEDEDSNVIFVSYIPPKSSKVAEQERELCEKFTETEMEIRQEEEIENSQTDVLENATKQENKICEEPGTDQTTEETQEEGMARINPVEEPGTNQTTEETQEEGTGRINPGVVSERENTPESDVQLKRKFGITADVQIVLQRISSTESKASPKKVPKIGSINKRTLDGIRKLIQSSRIEMKTKKLIETQVPSPKRETNLHESNLHDVKRKAEKQFENTVGEDTSQGNILRPEGSPSAEIEPASRIETFREQRDEETSESSATSKQSDCIASTSGTPESIEVAKQAPDVEENITEESEPATVSNGCPLAEAGLRSGGVPSSSVLQSKVTPPKKGKGKQCRAVQTNATFDLLTLESMDVCDSSAVLLESSPSRTSSNGTRSSELEVADVELKEYLQDAVPTVTSAEDTGPDSVGECCLPTLTESTSGLIDEPPWNDFFSATPMDPEEIKRHEKIKRLKELLKEKEAALEKIRKNML